MSGLQWRESFANSIYRLLFVCLQCLERCDVLVCVIRVGMVLVQYVSGVFV